MEATRGGRAIIVESDVFNFTATLFRHLVEQEPVYRTANAETKHVLVWMFLNFGDYLHVVAYIAVSHETDDAHVVLRIGGIECSLDGCHHFCSTGSGCVRKKLLGFFEILRRCRHRRRKQNPGIA